MTSIKPRPQPRSPARLASEQIVVEAPMSFTGSAKRLWRWHDRAWTGPDWLCDLIAMILIGLVWIVVLGWYLFFGIFLVPYRLIRRSSRKQERDNLRHQEMLEAARRR